MLFFQTTFLVLTYGKSGAYASIQYKTGQMAQPLTGLAALAKDKSSVPSIHMSQLTTACNPKGLPASGFCGHLHSCAHIPT